MRCRLQAYALITGLIMQWSTAVSATQCSDAISNNLLNINYPVFIDINGDKKLDVLYAVLWDFGQQYPSWIRKIDSSDWLPGKWLKWPFDEHQLCENDKALRCRSGFLIIKTRMDGQCDGFFFADNGIFLSNGEGRVEIGEFLRSRKLSVLARSSIAWQKLAKKLPFKYDVIAINWETPQAFKGRVFLFWKDNFFHNSFQEYYFPWISEYGG
jgi:hypothetical protein